MSTEKISILYLDDEEHNLTSFKAAFRRDFEIFTTTDAGEAVTILNNHEIHIVISDQKMPNLSGVEFFELIIPDFPDPIRILLTGYADIEAVIDAINKGQVYRYIAKPWDEQELRMSLINAHELYTNKSELRRKNEDLRKAYEELEKFIYSASHDLRAPLVSILGILKLTRHETFDEKSTEYFNMIERSVSKLDVFVQNIISYYQNLKQGALIAAIDFNLLIDELFEHYRFFEGVDNVKLLKEVDQAEPVYLDELRLKMILNNLISNGIRYSDSTKENSYTRVSVKTDNEKTTITVEDNGLGIKREDQKRVFDMFYRSSKATMGSGLGLYIMKEATSNMEGTVEMESEHGKGTRFTVVLPNSSEPVE
jgi:signal transduction histidine kinase